jgi:hypothetical protein
MQNVSLGRVEGMLAEHVFKHLGAIDIDHPNAAVVLVSKSKVGLERVALQDPGAKSLFNSGHVRSFKPPPCSDHLGRPILMAVIEPSREAPGVVDGFVELKRLRGFEAAHGAQQAPSYPPRSCRQDK